MSIKLSLTKLIPDKIYLQLLYYKHFKKFIDFKNPKTFNEKLQWLKLYDRKPEYTTMVDKYAVKKYVADIIGEEYIIPTLGVWDSPEDIDFDALPNQFVLKWNHDSGSIVICKDKSKLDREKALKKMNRGKKYSGFWYGREWPYKNVKPCIFAEAYMKDGENEVLPVYKIMCFSGEPKIIQAIQNDKQPNESIDYFDVEWNLLKLKQNFPNSDQPLPKPEKLTEMLEIAKVLSKNISFLRVDLYMVNGAIAFSEHTFYSDAGLAKFHPDSWDEKIGNWIKLPEIQGEQVHNK